MTNIRHSIKHIHRGWSKIPAVKMATKKSELSEKPSNVKVGANGFVRYIKGGSRSKIIISAPHGGYMRPASIPNRSQNVEMNCFRGLGGISVKSDVYTLEIALLLRDELTKMSSPDKQPHLVICELHRSKLDANRKMTEATLNVPNAVVAYNEFHEFLSDAKREIGAGILLDLHGHAHLEEWVELGYLISKRDLFRGSLRAEASSIRSLASTSPFSIEELITGPVSLGRFLQEEGIESIPSPKHKRTRGNFLAGGYNIAQHGSSREGKIDAIQIEIHQKYRNEERSVAFVTTLAKAIYNFMELHYGSI